MKIAFIGIIVIILIASFSIQNVLAHQPDFAINTPEDILKFCEFFYQEYKILGVDTLVNQHPNFPNLRACTILYNHVAWNSTHELRDRVLIGEIEKYLGSSDFTKERHLEEFTTMPDWIKKDLKLWVDGKSKDNQYAYGIRAMLQNNVLSIPVIDNVAIAQGSLTIRITEAEQVVQPGPFAEVGTTETVARTDIQVDEGENKRLTVYQSGVTLQEMVNGLNALGIGPRDMITILQAVKTAGALQAEIEVM